MSPVARGGAGELLATRAVSLRYNAEQVLDGINFSIREREIVTIVGPNGSGKSTFLRLLIGAIEPDAGTVSRRKGLRIGYVPQRLSFDANLPVSVQRFLQLGIAKPASATRPRSDAIARWSSRIGIEHLMHKQLAELSGGQMQRVMLAQAMLADPQLLILDEATQGLDQHGEAAFYRLVEAVRNEQGCAVLLVSHDLHVVMSASDRVICLNGHVCCEGTPTLVSAAPEYRALFGLGTEGTLALYRHEHDHVHDPAHDHDHDGENQAGQGPHHAG